MPESKRGYELIRKDPVYTYDTIQGITTEALILHNIKCVNPTFSNHVRRIQKWGSESLHVLECMTHEAMLKVEAEHTTVKRVKAEKVISAGEEYPCLDLVDICALDPGGCFIIKEAIENNNRSFLIGIALMYYLLDVYTWWEMNMYQEVDDCMSHNVLMRQDREDHDSSTDPDVEMPDPDSWENFTGDVYLHSMNVEVTIANVKKQKHEWKAAKETTQKVLSQMLAYADIEYLERVIQEKSGLGAWYRGILYLIEHKFNFIDYAHVDEDYDLPAINSFGILWDADDMLAVWDEHANGYHEGGPAALSNHTYVFEDGIRTTKDKNPKELMYVFSALFYYDPKKQSFYNVKDDDIQAYLSALRLHKWQGVLRRAIKGCRKRGVL